MKAFFDTNVLLYTLAKDDGRKQDIALELIYDGGCVSAQVLNEFASAAHRKLKMSWAAIRSNLHDLRLLLAAPAAVTVSTHELALALAEQHKFALYDALIIASALEAKCTKLYTEDMQHGMVVRQSLQITNPFLPAAQGIS